MTGFTLVLHRQVAPGVNDTAEFRLPTLASAEEAGELMTMLSRAIGMEPVAIVPLGDVE